jgi:hypothetical protein
MRRLKLVVVTVFLALALAPAVMPRAVDTYGISSNDGSFNMRVAVVSAFENTDVPRLSTDDMRTRDAGWMSLQRYATRTNDADAIDRWKASEAAYRAYRADPGVAELQRRSEERWKAIALRDFVQNDRRLVWSSTLLVGLVAIGAVGVRRLRRGANVLGGALLIAAIGLAPLAAPVWIQDQPRVGVPLLSMVSYIGADRVSDTFELEPSLVDTAPPGEIWTPAAIEAMKPLVDVSRYARWEALEAKQKLDDDVGAAKPRFSWLPYAVCLGALSCVVLRKLESADPDVGHASSLAGMPS